jgi:hypothetical protein
LCSFTLKAPWNWPDLDLNPIAEWLSILARPHSRQEARQVLQSPELSGFLFSKIVAEEGRGGEGRRGAPSILDTSRAGFRTNLPLPIGRL